LPAGFLPTSRPWGSAHCPMENRLLVEVTNDSEHTFEYDGEWLRSGSWKSDRTMRIAPGALTVLEFHSDEPRGVAGVVWWTDASEHNIYLSMVLGNPRLQAPVFSSYAGLPPQDLKAELESAPRLIKDEQVTAEDGGCMWSAAVIGNFTAVRLTILPNLERYVPRTAATAAAEAAEEAEAIAAAAAAEEATAAEAAAVAGSAHSSSSSAAAAEFPCPAQPPSNGTAGAAAEPCTTLQTVSDAAEELASKEALGKFMAQTRPKDAVDGLSRGLKTAGGSVLAGMGNVVASSIQGYHQQGGLGLLKGLGMGVVGGAAIAVGGTACGVAQIGRGLANTPEAFRNRREQRVWDQELGAWVDIDLCVLENQVEAEGSDDEESQAAKGSIRAEVADSELYDLLKIRPDASPSDIKKAYYKEARQCHPDKNPGDREANARFQRLADAYQVLSDPQLRKKYDREGKEGIQQGRQRMDPSLFFSLLFGSERFDPWIGELHLAMQTDQFAKALERADEDQEQSAEDSIAEGDAMSRSLRRRQFRREVRCACHLRNILDRFVSYRDIDGFESQMRTEAASLASGQFGPATLCALGEIYVARSEIYLADELVGRFSFKKQVASMRHSGLTARHRWHLCQHAVGSIMRVKRVHDAATNSAASASIPKADNETTPTEEEQEQENQEQESVVEAVLDEALPTFLQTAWAAVVTDIDGTIKEVGRKLLKDKSVPWQIRIRRAQGLQRLGQIFLEEGEKAKAVVGGTETHVLTSEAAKAALQEALMGSVRENR